MNRRLLLLAALLVILSLVGCGPAGAPTPEAAAAELIAQSSENGAANDVNSIQALQQQELGGSVYVVLSYRRMWNNRDQTCLMAYETHQQPFRGWFSRGGAGSCMENDDPPVSGLDVSGGTSFGQDPGEPDISYVLGRVMDERIVKVDVTWEDGRRQLAEVENGTILAVREGDVQLKSVVGLSESSEPVE